jgi:hypothetical protein
MSSQDSRSSNYYLKAGLKATRPVIMMAGMWLIRDDFFRLDLQDLKTFSRPAACFLTCYIVGGTISRQLVDACCSYKGDEDDDFLRTTWQPISGMIALSKRFFSLD